MSKSPTIWLARLSSLVALFLLMFLPWGVYYLAAEQPLDASYGLTMTLLLIGCGLGAGGAYAVFALVLSKVGRLGPDEINKEWRPGT